MVRFSVRIPAIAFLACANAYSIAQEFRNLDFEEANIFGNHTVQDVFPGWTFDPNLTTDPYDINPPDGLPTRILIGRSISLVSPAGGTAAIEGEFSLFLNTSWFGTEGIAFSQRAIVPGDSNSISLLAWKSQRPFGSGPEISGDKFWRLFLDDEEIEIFDEGVIRTYDVYYDVHRLVGDISAHAGELRTLRIEIDWNYHGNFGLRPNSAFDKIEFSPEIVVPEPNGAGLLSIATMGMMFRRRRCTWMRQCSKSRRRLT